MKKYTSHFIVALLALMAGYLLYAATPTVTRTKDISVRGRYQVVKHSYAVTRAAIDSALVLDADGNPFEVGELKSQQNKVVTLLFNTTEAHDESTHKIIIWQGSNVSDPGTGIADSLDWVDLERDTALSSDLFVQTIDLDATPVAKLRVIVADSSGGVTDGEGTEEVYIYVPKRELD